VSRPLRTVTFLIAPVFIRRVDLSSPEYISLPFQRLFFLPSEDSFLALRRAPELFEHTCFSGLMSLGD